MGKNTAESKSNDGEAKEAIEQGKRISGIRAKYDAAMMGKIREQIDVFRREKFASGFPQAINICESAGNDGGELETEAQKVARRNAYDCESPLFDEEKMKEVITRNCGKMYWDFLESGHPLARFWVQLRNGLEVIPRTEYVYYIQSILERNVEDTADLGSSRMKMEFMKKYGFESDEEVEEYLVTVLRESDVENVIGVE